MSNSILIIGHIILSAIVGISAGQKRRIGVYWSLFFCLTSSFIFGYAIICFSSRKADKPYTNTTAWRIAKLILGAFLIICSIFLFELYVKKWPTYKVHDINDYIIGLVPLFAMGLGLFLGWYTNTELYNRSSVPSVID